MRTPCWNGRRRGKRVLFFPDQHLGRNTARAMGIPLSEMPLWDPGSRHRAAPPIRRLRPRQDDSVEGLLLRAPACFTVEQVERARKAYPGVKVIVHPSARCRWSMPPTVLAPPRTSSRRSPTRPPGSAIAVGTEINLVNRLAAQYPDKTVFCLDPVVCPCSTMYRIHPGLPGLGFGEPRSRQRGQSHHRGRRHRPRSQGGTGAHAARSPVIRPWRSSYMRGAVRVAD